MPQRPTSTHDTHELELIAAHAAGDAGGADLDRATTLIGSCAACGALHRDLRAIAAAMPELPAPVRSRDFRLTPGQAASLRPTGIRGLLATLSGPRFSFATPLGTGLAALGIVGVLVASGGFATGGATSGAADTGAAGVTLDGQDAADPAAAPELAPAPSAGRVDTLTGGAEAAPSLAPALLSALGASPNPSADTTARQKLTPVGGTGAATGDASPVAMLSFALVFLGFALLAARIVSRTVARAP